jgi:hypothetical protein
MARWRRGEKLTTKRRQRGSGSSRDHGEVLPTSFELGDGDDGVQESTVRSLAKRRLQKCPATPAGGGWRLELRWRGQVHGRIVTYRERKETAVVPRDSGGWGGTGGKVVGAGALCSPVNCSPKFLPRTARSGRG